MKLTPFASSSSPLVILAVVGYAFWHYKGARRCGSGRSARPTPAPAPAARSSASDFDALKNAPPDPERGSGADGRHAGGARRRRQARTARWSSASTPGPATRRASSSTAAWIRTRSSRYKKQVRPRREVRAARRPGREARRVPQGRRRHHVGHGRQLGARGLDPRRAEPEGQVDHHAGLVARRRRHRLALDRSSRSKI